MEERQGIRHHLLDAVDITDAGFSVAEYQRRASDCIDDITARGKLPLIVGGTGLYINALTYPLRFTNVAGDEAVRAKLLAQEEEQPGILHLKLKEIDPQSAERLHHNDIKRVVRALEVFEVSGRTLSSYGSDFVNNAQAEAPYRASIAGLTMERDALYARIEQRVDAMMRLGLLEETQRLYDAGYTSTLPALQGLGYKQLLRYFDGQMTLDEAVDDIKRETRRFSKRQITWFKRDQRIRWFDVFKFSDIMALSDAVASYYTQSMQQDEGEGDHS